MFFPSVWYSTLINSCPILFFPLLDNITKDKSAIIGEDIESIDIGDAELFKRENILIFDNEIHNTNATPVSKSTQKDNEVGKEAGYLLSS